MPPGTAELVNVIRRAGISDERLLSAFADIPRAEFVPSSLADLAYEDQPLPIPHDQVTTQPSLSAVMIDALALRPEDRVLEIGTGYGFQTALLARIARRVTSIEMWPELADWARSALRRFGLESVDVMVGDGTLGVPEMAPFDAILVSAAFTAVPTSLVDQLVDGGRLVQPMGPGGSEMVTLFHKAEGTLVSQREIIPARFVRLIGRQGFPPAAE